MNTSRYYKNKYCRFTKNKIKKISYLDIEILKKYIDENNKIIPKRITGTKTKFQNQLSKSIKIARKLALLPI